MNNRKTRGVLRQCQIKKRNIYHNDILNFIKDGFIGFITRKATEIIKLKDIKFKNESSELNYPNYENKS